MNQSTDIATLREQTPAVQQRGLVTAEVERAAQEIQAALVIAKKFPRDEEAAYARIMKACKRPGLAEAGMYSYVKGGSEITGPSIRLAEAMAQAWGNMIFGWRELARYDEYSEVEAYAWDLETNSRSPMQFTVRHEFKNRQGIRKLEDPREIYENMANQASRRLRACVLRLIPGDIQDAAVDACEDTLKKGSTKSLSDRVRDMLAAFQNEYNVNADMIRARLNKDVKAISETDLVQLRKIYTSLRDNMASPTDYFSFDAKPAGTTIAEEKKKTEAQQQKPPAQEQTGSREAEQKETAKAKDAADAGVAQQSGTAAPDAGATKKPPAEPKGEPSVTLDQFMQSIMECSTAKEVEDVAELINELPDEDKADAKDFVEKRKQIFARSKKGGKRSVD